VEGRDVARYGLAPPPTHKNIVCPSNEMKPISSFGLRLMFSARFVSKELINCIIFDQFKELAAGIIYFSSNLF